MSTEPRKKIANRAVSNRHFGKSGGVRGHGDETEFREK